MSRQHTVSRIAALVGALALVGSSLAVVAPAVAAASPQGHPFAKTVASHRQAGVRGRVNVADLAAHPSNRPQTPSRPAIRPDRAPAKPGTSGPKALLASPPIQATTTAGVPAAVTSFAGLSRSTPLEAAVEPPDPWLAVGPDDVVQAVNLMFRVTDRNGANAIDTVLGDFFFLPDDGTMGDSDPRVIFDALHNRWVAVEVSWDCSLFPPFDTALFGHGYLDVAISDTADPRGTWSVYFRVYDDQFPDYPGLGTSSDKVVASTNVFDMVASSNPSDPTVLDCIGTNFAGADMSVFDWADLTNGNNLLYQPLGPDTGAFTVRPSVQAPATTPTAYFVDFRDTGGGGIQIEEGTVTGSVVANTIDTTAIVLDTVISPPVLAAAPHQPGAPATIVDAFDERITDAVWQANKMTFVATYPCTPTGDVAVRDCVRVSQLATTATPTLLQDFLVAQTGEDVYMGGIGVTGNGALHVVWTQSSATAGHFPSTFGAYQLPTDPANSLSAPQALGAGDSTYAGTRWGDYVGVPQDPQDPNAVWQAHEHSAAGTWATTVTQNRTGTGSTYVPIAPVRVLNTTNNTGLTGKFTSSVARTFQVTGVLGIPANAKAITGNLAVTGQNGAGFVSVTVSPTNVPATSTINFPLGDIRANNLTTPLSATGTLSAVYKSTAGKTTHLVLDVTGYFLEDDSGATYNTIAPVRMLNTIAGTGLIGKFQHALPRTFQVTGVMGIPANATAISGNLAVTGQSAAGFVSVTPDPIVAPTTSTINFPKSDVRANGLTVQLSATGTLSMVYRAVPGATTDLVLDVSGYYVQDLLGLRFFPLNPGRRINTTIGSPIGVFHSAVPQTVAMDGHEGVPLAASAITGNLAVTGQTSAGFVSITLVSDPAPATSIINFPVGDVRANGVTVPVNGSGAMWFVYRGSGSTKTTHLVLDVTGYFK